MFKQQINLLSRSNIAITRDPDNPKAKNLDLHLSDKGRVLHLGWFAVCWVTLTELTSTEFNNAPLTNGWTMLNSLRLIRWLTLQWRQGCSLTRNGADRGCTHDCANTLGFTVCICARMCVHCSMLSQPYSLRPRQPTAHTHLGATAECLTTE